MAARKRSSKAFKWAFSFAIVLSLPLLVWSSLSAATHARLESAFATLERELGPFDLQAPARQRGQESAAATRIQRLAARAGQHLSLQAEVDWYGRGHVPHINDCERYLRHRFLGAPLDADERERMEDWLVAHGRELEELAQAIAAEAPELQFRHDPEAVHGDDVPHYKGPYTCAHLLTLRALTRLDEGEPAAADQLLAAAWQLTEEGAFPMGHLRRLYRSEVREAIALVLRRLPGPHDEWEARLAAADPLGELASRHGDVVMDLFGDANMSLQGGLGPYWSGREWSRSWFEEHAFLPLRRWAVAGQLEDLRELRSLLRANEMQHFIGRCVERHEESIFWTDMISGGRVGCLYVKPSLEAQWQLELTRQVLAARRLVADDPAALGSEQVLDGRRHGDRWLRRIGDDGSIRVEFAGTDAPQFPAEWGGVGLPRTHREPAADVENAP